MHTGSAELSLNKLKWSAFILMTYQGERYALNQNIPSNLLEDFVLIDCGASYDFQFKQQHLLVRATLNNLTNNYYSYMRYFVMPGINFNIHLTYAL
jgi:outer membrane receptor protein involved in Fe transport